MPPIERAGEGGGASEEDEDPREWDDGWCTVRFEEAEDGDGNANGPVEPGRAIGSAGTRNPSASTRSRDFESSPFHSVDDVVVRLSVLEQAEKIESVPDASPSLSPPPVRDETEDEREDGRRWKLGKPRGDDGRPCPIPSAGESEPEWARGEGDRGGARREAVVPAGVGEKTSPSASAAGRGRTGVGGMIRGDAMRAKGRRAGVGAGESGERAAFVIAWSAPRPPGGGRIWIALDERLTGLDGASWSASATGAAAGRASEVGAMLTDSIDASETAWFLSESGRVP